VEEEILPYADEWVKHGYPYKELHPKGYKAGVLGAIYPVEFGGTVPEGATKSDAFHELIMWDELSRCGSIPAAEGILGQHSINSMAVPPIMKYGPPHLKDKVARAVVTGEQNICLAISEPSAGVAVHPPHPHPRGLFDKSNHARLFVPYIPYITGSDVANIRTEAIKEGDCYVVNGEKKWITGGLWADWFTLCCRTGGPGGSGLSLLLVDAKTPGIKVRQLDTQGEAGHHTTYITFEDVRVPLENLCGEEGKGFKYVLENFNHERFVIAVGANRGARVCLEEAMRHARSRKTFGKRLMDHPVIRHKLAEMTRMVEGCHDSIERVAYQLKSGAPDSIMGGPCGLLKVQASIVFEFCAREAAQIFGGASIIKEGRGKVVERMYRAVRSCAIPGGSEEILRDLAIRTVDRQWKA